jgi:hypothetical protein
MKLTSPSHPSDLDRVRHNLSYHSPTREVQDVMALLRQKLITTADQICTLVPAGRERSMALTAIEDACMYAIAGLARATVEDAQGDEDPI